MDWNQARALFSLPRERSYLDTATQAPGARAVVAAMGDFLARWAEGSGDWRAWEAAGEAARCDFARLLATEPACVALVPSVSYAAAVAAASLEVGPGANVVVGDGEFRSNFFPWLTAERRGIGARVVPFRDGRAVAADLLAAVDARTALVAVSHVQSSSGHVADLERLGAECRRRGVRLFVDATQSLGAIRVPMEHVDYLATAAYKWLLAPRGVGFLWVAPRELERVVALAPGWKSAADPYAGYYGPPLDLAPRASRCDLSLAWSVWVGGAAALQLVTTLGLAAIEPRVRGLAGRFRAGLAELGREPLFAPEETAHIVSLRVERPDAVRESLARAGVAAAVRDRYLRLSFHFFNDEEDVERALRALHGA